MLDLLYPKEKLTTAVSIMATHPGDIKDRLFKAFLEFHTIGNEMPKPFRNEYEWIVQELTKVGDDVDGRVLATLKTMTDDHALEIASRIVDLAFQMYETH